MKLDIILSGVGGQGILSISTIIGEAAIQNGLYLKQAEVHGMSQRGGEVQSHLRISDKPIFSDLIQMGKAHLIISVEPMESLRYLPYLDKTGWLVTNTTPFVNIPNYPPLDDILAEINKLPNHICIDADKVATELGSKLSMNMVMLGVATEFMPISLDHMAQAIRSVFASKGESVVEKNLAALTAGNIFAKQNK